LEYRHTYATQRAGEGWTLFRIAKEMGNSVAIVEQYYAAYIRADLAYRLGTLVRERKTGPSES
jgi:hypothetical protein